LTVKVSFWPPATVTVMVHVAAEAAGRAMNAVAPRTAAASPTASASLRIIDTVVSLL
jgi:hypothetical protein